MQGDVQDELDYLAVGHVTRDLTPGGGFTIGGTVAYAARTARGLGRRVGVLTSAPEDLCLADALPGIPVVRLPSPTATIFENRHTDKGRVQVVWGVASPLTPADVPPAWREAPLVHLGPVAGECAPSLIDHFPAAFVGLTPQGWMRQWDAEGRVRPAPWEDAEVLLARADAVVLSEDDVGANRNWIARWAARAEVLVVTRGAAGCTAHSAGRVTEIPGLPVREVDPTGAGDIFAAVLFCSLQRGASTEDAARLANCVAAVSVTRAGLDATPSTEEIERCRSLC